jgi:hypothetical protein
MDPCIRAGLSTEKAAGAFFFIYPEIAVPGEGTFRTYFNTFPGLTGNAYEDLLFFGPV